MRVKFGKTSFLSTDGLNNFYLRLELDVALLEEVRKIPAGQ